MHTSMSCMYAYVKLPLPMFAPSLRLNPFRKINAICKASVGSLRFLVHLHKAAKNHDDTTDTTCERHDLQASQTLRL